MSKDLKVENNELYFEFDPRVLSVPQAIHKVFRHTARWYSLRELEIKKKTNNASMWYCKASLEKII